MEHIAEYLINNGQLDADDIRDTFEPCEVIYYSECDEVMREYEQDHWRDAEELTDGMTFSASEWQQAQVAYCNALKHCGETAALHAEIDTAEEEIQSVIDEAESLGCDDPKIEYSHDCPHGWMAHNRETAGGIMVWSDEPGHYNPQLIEGECYAVSLKLSCGVYATITWTREDAE